MLQAVCDVLATDVPAFGGFGYDVGNEEFRKSRITKFMPCSLPEKFVHFLFMNWLLSFAQQVNFKPRDFPHNSLSEVRRGAI
jgi:hypothetical protein